MRVLIRAEEKNDVSGVHAVNTTAFETHSEADLVDALREQASPVVSLVADQDGVIVGHIMLSPVTLSGHPEVKIMGLGPMAVVPEVQRRGIGSELVRAGLEQCRQLGFTAVVVLGHPDYYPRFGFSPASHFDIDSEYEVPDDVFLAMELQPGALNGVTGRVQYHAAFGNV